MHIRVHALIFAGTLSMTPLSAYADTDFVVITQKVNPVMAPKTPGDVFKECANNQICKSAAVAAASYLGVPPTAVSAALSIVPQATRSGEEGHYAISLPNGYQYCRSAIRTISVVPATGNRASVWGSALTNLDWASTPGRREEAPEKAEAGLKQT